MTEEPPPNRIFAGSIGQDRPSTLSLSWCTWDCTGSKDRTSTQFRDGAFLDVIDLVLTGPALRSSPRGVAWACALGKTSIVTDFIRLWIDHTTKPTD